MSNYSLAIRLLAEPLRSLAFGSIGASYMGIGTAFVHPIRLLYIQNLTDVAVLFSLDGINDHWILPTEGYMIVDITANKTREQGWYIAEGTRLYAKEFSGPPTQGGVYVSTFYGSENGQ